LIKERLGMTMVVVAACFVVPLRADLIFNLNQTGIAGFSSGPTYATVDLKQIDAHTVSVTETLASGDVFAVSAGDSLEFTIDKSFSYLAGSMSSGFTGHTSGDSAPGYGSYGSYVECTSCGPGTSPPRYSGPLSFEVYNAGGLLLTDFVANNDGYYFASDIGLSKGGDSYATGVVASNIDAATPEPSALVLMSTCAGLFLVKLRKRGKGGR
jgi:hypothetical protein